MSCITLEGRGSGCSLACCVINLGGGGGVGTVLLAEAFCRGGTMRGDRGGVGGVLGGVDLGVVFGVSRTGARSGDRARRLISETIVGSHVQSGTVGRVLPGTGRLSRCCGVIPCVSRAYCRTCSLYSFAVLGP